MDRLSQFSSHLNGAKGVAAIKQQSPSDVVIVAAYRTALCKGFKGSFKETPTEDILARLLAGVLEKIPNLPPTLIEDVVVGNVLKPGSGVTPHRASAIASGIPYTAGFMSLNRQCSSGLAAVNDVAMKIQTGAIECGVAAGVESMTLDYVPGDLFPSYSESIMNVKDAANCCIPMGITNENIAAKYNIERAAQDEFAANSYNRAERSVAAGLFKNEIIPIKNTAGLLVSQDECPRPGVTAASLGKIKPAFSATGSTHAGNASQITDGAGAVVLMSRALATRLNLTVVAKFVACSSVGVPPEIMGVGPAYAIPHVLTRVGISSADVAIYEINEAFAAQALFCVEHLGLDMAKVNPRGGAIAMGHPLGATGARQVATILNQLEAGEIGVTSMCMGTGMGCAAVFVKE